MGLQDRDYLKKRDHVRLPPGMWDLPANTRRSPWWKPIAIVLGLLFGTYFAIMAWPEADPSTSGVARRTPSLFGPAAMPFPPTGPLLWYVTPPGQAEPGAPFKVSVPAGSANHVLRVSDWQTAASVLLLAIRPGESAEVKLPLGQYRITYAWGGHWFGTDRQFNDPRAIAEGLRPLEFVARNGRFEGHTLDFSKRVDGNFRTVPAHRL